MCLPESKALVRAAVRLYVNDVRVNGGPENAPYRIQHEGVVYIARLRDWTNDEGQTFVRLEIEQPKRHVATVSNLQGLRDFDTETIDSNFVDY